VIVVSFTLSKEDGMAARKSTRKSGRSSARKSSGRKYGKKASKSVESAMRRKKGGTLRRGKGGRGGKVKSRKQAIAIGLSEARKKGAKVPRKSSSRKRSSKRSKS
jgi:hypothetical protein